MSDESRQLSKLYELSMMLSGDPLEVFGEVARMIGEYFDVRVVCLSEIRGDELYFISVYADGEVKHDAGVCNLDVTPCSTVKEDRDINVYQQVIDLFPKATFLKTHDAYSYCGFPALSSEGEVLAVTCLLDDKPREFSERDLELLRIFGQRIAVELERKANTELHNQTEHQMRKLSQALEQSADIVEITDKDGMLEYVNPEFERVTGYSNDEVVGRKSGFIKSGLHEDDFYDELWTTIKSGMVYKGVITNKKKNGQLYHEEKSIAAIKNEVGDITNYVSTGRDITERIENEERLDFLAHYDALTWLPNRVLFTSRMEQFLQRAAKQGAKAVVLLIDIDRFKTINDTLGHDIGDQMLIQYSARMRDLLEEDTLIARLGGDEFAILLESADDEQHIAECAGKLLETIEAPLNITGYQLHATASIGISRYPNDGDSSVALIKNADIAMYQAKDMGRNSYQFFSSNMVSRDVQHLALENDLRGAMEREEFMLYYQPQVDIQSGRITGVEALLRWNHADLGVIQPLEFIPLLEETGLITQVGPWVIETACKQLQVWHQQGFPDLTMAINISGRQFYGQGFIEHLRDSIQKHDIQPGQLELEITENILMEDQEGALASIRDLYDLGFRIAIDDFGTGYSSLSYLRRFRVNVLKVDKSFTREIATNSDSAAITSAIIAMAQSMKLDIVVEGVEDKQQLDMVQELGCQVAQGYLFSRPVASDEMTEQLKKNNE